MEQKTCLFCGVKFGYDMDKNRLKKLDTLFFFFVDHIYLKVKGIDESTFYGNIWKCVSGVDNGVIWTSGNTVG
jgi:hypothetical protein